MRSGLKLVGIRPCDDFRSSLNVLSSLRLGRPVEESPTDMCSRCGHERSRHMSRSDD